MRKQANKRNVSSRVPRCNNSRMNEIQEIAEIVWNKRRSNF